MKKRILSVLAAVCLTLATFNAGAQAFDEGKSVVTLGYGFPNIISSTFRSAYNSVNHTNYSFTAVGPMFLRYEYGLSEKIGMGIVLGYSMASISYNYQDWNSNYTQQVTYTQKIVWNSPTAGLRFNIHFATKDKLDPYFAIGAGWSGNTLTYTDNNPRQTNTNQNISFTPFYFGLGVGLKYYFTENIGFYTEFGFDKWALLQVGLAAKF
jgi:hypothetical protein